VGAELELQYVSSLSQRQRGTSITASEVNEHEVTPS
jgi:hypothetical protein